MKWDIVGSGWGNNPIATVVWKHYRTDPYYAGDVLGLRLVRKR